MSAARKLPDSATCVKIRNDLWRPYQRNDYQTLIFKICRPSTFSFWFFYCFPQINVGFSSANPFIFLQWKTHSWPIQESFSRLPLESRLWQLATSLGTVRELGHSVSVQCFYHDLFLIYVPFSLLSFVLSIFVYNLCYVVMFGVCLFIDYIHS